MDILLSLIIILMYGLIALLFGPYYARKMIREFSPPKGKNVTREQINGLFGLYAFVFGAVWPIFIIELMITTLKRRRVK